MSPAALNSDELLRGLERALGIENRPNDVIPGAAPPAVTAIYQQQQADKAERLRARQQQDAETLARVRAEADAAEARAVEAAENVARLQAEADTAAPPATRSDALKAGLTELLNQPATPANTNQEN